MSLQILAADQSGSADMIIITLFPHLYKTQTTFYLPEHDDRYGNMVYKDTKRKLMCPWTSKHVNIFLSRGPK